MLCPGKKHTAGTTKRDPREKACNNSFRGPSTSGPASLKYFTLTFIEGFLEVGQSCYLIADAHLSVNLKNLKIGTAGRARPSSLRRAGENISTNQKALFTSRNRLGNVRRTQPTNTTERFAFFSDQLD